VVKLSPKNYFRKITSKKHGSAHAHDTVTELFTITDGQGSSSFGTALNRVSRFQKHATEAKMLATSRLTSMLTTMVFRTRNVFTGLRK
jgi:hypothetical protein